MYRQRAAKLGPSVETMVVRLLEQGQGFVDTRKIWGILSLDKRYRPDRIDAACRQALEMGNLGYRAVKIWLEAEEAAECERAQAASPAQPAPVLRKTAHQHVRPLSVYQEQLTLVMQ